MEKTSANNKQSTHKNEEISGNSDGEVTWKDLGLSDVLCNACERLKWKSPSKIQREAIPLALQGRDVIGLAETGSGKTAAFALPILNSLLEKPQKYFALILTPTRELALQILEQFQLLGGDIGLKCAAVVGGVNKKSQAVALSRNPHVVIATPGRLLDHLDNTKNFHLTNLKYLVMDEADRILGMNFELELTQILKIIPKERRTFLFSATMTEKVDKLQKASLQNPVKIKVSTMAQTAQKLLQYYMFIPLVYKDMYLVHILNKMPGNVCIIFCSTWINTARTTYLLKLMGISAAQLHGKMSQKKRLEVLNKFKDGERPILVTTNVASRGLDIPHVDVVINFDHPTSSKDYIHRVGRTARAGRSGRAITFVTQYDIELYQRLEFFLGKKLPLFETNESEVLALKDRVFDAQKKAKVQVKEFADKKRKKRKGQDKQSDQEDSQSEQGPRVKKQKKRRR